MHSHTVSHFNLTRQICIFFFQKAKKAQNSIKFFHKFFQFDDFFLTKTAIRLKLVGTVDSLNDKKSKNSWEFPFTYLVNSFEEKSNDVQLKKGWRLLERWCRERDLTSKRVIFGLKTFSFSCTISEQEKCFGGRISRLHFLNNDGQHHWIYRK